MLLARRGPDSDIHLIVTDDKKQFFCLHTDRTKLRTWEPLESMNVNQAFHHVEMHKQLGHKVPENLIDKIKVQYFRQP